MDKKICSIMKYYNFFVESEKRENNKRNLTTDLYLLFVVVVYHIFYIWDIKYYITSYCSI